MSLWGFDGEENTLTTWSSLNEEFDEMIWSDFGENGDHVVPDPNINQEWIANGDIRKKRNHEISFTGFTNTNALTSRGGSDSCTETGESEQYDEDGIESKKDVPPRDMLSGGSWSDIGSVVDLPLASQPFSSDSMSAPQEREDISHREIKEQSVNMLTEGVQLYIGEEDGSMVTDPFSLNEMGSQSGGLELFGNENTTSKAEALPDLGWANIGNLDDMDKFFRNNDASFDPVMGGTTDGLEWPSSSSQMASDPDSSMQFEKPPNTTEQGGSRAMKVKVDSQEKKVDSCLEESPILHSTEKAQAVVGFGNMNTKTASPKPSDPQTSAQADQVAVRRLEKSDAVREAKAHRARRHAANKKRSEERFRRGSSYRKLSPGPPYPVHHADLMQLQKLPLRFPGQPSHLHLGVPASGLPVFPPVTSSGLMSVPAHQFQMPQNLPYIQVGYPVHHMPFIAPGPSKPMAQVQHSQPMFIDPQQPGVRILKTPNQLGHPMSSQPVPKASFQAPASIEQQRQPPPRPTFDASSRPPTCSPSMTPQEKLEKLRWRQQMQARIAVEQQQQQFLASQYVGGVEPPIFQKQQQASSQARLHEESSDGLTQPSVEVEQRRLTPGGEDEQDDSLEGSVLYQLEMTISRLDINTRLCVRNALYRLASSARKRRAAGGENGSSSPTSGERKSGSNAMESSTASDSPSCRGSRAQNISEVETETNPIDRSIAKLLFCKPPPQYLPGPIYLPEDSPYHGVPQLPPGAPHAPWGWPTPSNNCVGPPGPPGPPQVQMSLPWGCNTEDGSAFPPSWAPLPVMNGYRPPGLPVYHMDPRFGATFSPPRSRANVGGPSFVPAQNSELKLEARMSPPPSLQADSCSSPCHVAGNRLRVTNTCTTAAGSHAIAQAQDREYRGDAINLAMEQADNGTTPFVPERIKTPASANARVQEVAHGGQFNSTDDSEQFFGQRNEPACITEDPVQHLSTIHHDEAGKLNQLPVLESLSFPTRRLDMAPAIKAEIPEAIR